MALSDFHGPGRYRQGVLAACCVPWDENSSLLKDVFRRHIRFVLDRGFRDVYIFGTAGEGYAVDMKRFEQVVAVFAEETNRPGVQAQVGVIALSTAHAIERLRIAHASGFRSFQISLPPWGKVDDDEMMRYFEDVCGAFPDSLFLHYNVRRSQRMLTGSDYRRIADRVPNLAATKITSANVYDPIDLMRCVPDLQHFFLEQIYPIGALHGPCSLLSSMGVVLPAKTMQLFEFGRQKRFGELFALWREYMAVSYAILQPLEGTARMDGAYDKLCARIVDGEMPLRLLSPYIGFGEHEYQLCSQIARTRFHEWLR
jgi:dihydrodipicolinate synthase/N-acetylneuraminate lyase